MRSPRNRRFRANFRYVALSFFAAASLSLFVFGVVRFGASANVASVVGPNKTSATAKQPLSAIEEKRVAGDKLQNVSGLFFFELDNTLQKLENIGTSNDVSNFTYLADSEPVFSPDGSKILFRTQRAADFPPANPGELWVTDPTGYNQRRLTFNSSTEGNFSFSRNGQKITFQHLFEDRIWVMNADGTGLTEIPNPSDDSTSRPSLSPDGSKVVFERNFTIWIADSDGTNLQILTQGGGEYPFFSHDGQKVYWTSGAAIYRANPDGTGEETVVDGSNDSYNNFRAPTLSPDGQKLLFECDRFTSGICVAPTNGSNTIDLIEEPEETLEKPVWSPNGSQIAYVRTGQDGNNRINISGANGANRFEAFNAGPSRFIGRLAWQPECDGTGGPGEPPINTNGLVSWWRGEFTAEDSFGDNDGEFAEPAYVTGGRVGNAFYFNGNGEDNFVVVPDNSSLDVQAANYTLAGWVNLQEGQREHYFFGKGACCSGSNFYIGVDVDNRPFIDISHESGGSRVAAFGHELDLYTWTHLALRREGNEFRLYKNGQHVVTHTENQTIGTNDAPFTIGKGDGVTAPELTAFGMADEVVIYNRALSDVEIQTLANMTGAMLGSTNCPPVQKSRISLGGPFLFPVAQGRSVQVEIRVSEPAPVGGTAVSLQSTDPAAMSVPVSVTIPEGSVNTFFDVTTILSVPPSTVYASADIIATEGADTARTTVVIAPASADLAASNVVAPPTVNILQNFNADITVTNNGQVATGSYREDEIWISQDPVLFNDPGDNFVGLKFDNAGVLAPGQSKVFTATNINIPSIAIPTDGTYYLFYRVGRNVPERNGNFQDNYAFVPIQVNRNLPDLIAENVQIPAEIEPGVQFSITWDVRNAGSAATQSGFSHIVYISFDQTIGNADDVAIGQRFSPAFAVGQSQSFSQQYTVPTLPVRDSSDALIYVVVDTGGQVFEDNPGGPAEVNNTTSVATRFEYRVPDLQVQSVTPPAEVDSDTQFPFQWNTANTGLRDSNPMWERVYFSTDNQVGGDVLLGEFLLNQPIAAGDTVNRAQNVTIPTNAISATGDYYLYVQTDAFNNVNEGSNENNNITFSPIRVRRLLRPDLAVTNITAPPTAFFDQEIQVQWTVSNNGTGPTNAPNWTDRLYIGPNPSLNAATPLATTSNISFLDAGESYVASATVRIPRGISGNYHLIVNTDVNNTVNEEVENNNLNTRSITINVPLLPDLRVSNVQAPDEGFGGAPIAVSWTVTNNGDGPVPANESNWTDTVILSRDAVLDGGDPVIGSRPRNGSLTSGGNYTVSNFSVTLPQNAFGEYYVFVVTDAFGQVYEFNDENNNSDYDRVEPGSPLNVLGTPPDLTIPAPINAPSSIVAGQGLTASFTVLNQGAFDAVGNWREALYLSADQNLDPLNDILLGATARTSLGAGQSYAPSMNVTIPTCLNGTYYLIAATDAYNSLFEFDPKGNGETNNLSQPKAIDISSFAPDLRVTDITVPPVVINGAMPISWTVKNFGSGATVQTSWADRVYLINNNQLFNLGTFPRQGGLAIDGEYTQNQVVNIPLFLQGDVIIFVETDFYNAVPECSFEENNQDSAATQLQSDLPDLRINTIQAPGSASLGSQITVDWTAQNFGSPVNSQSWVDRVYLSSDATFSFGDVQIGGSLLNQSLGTNGTYSRQVTATIPNLPVGNYYLIVVSDADGNVAEGINDNNNATAVPITLTAPAVDLQVTTVNVDPVIYSGQFANISWTVTNTGSQATASSTWSDWVVLSRDAIYDPSDTLLEFRRRNEGLAAGGSYTENRQIAIPAGLTGDYRILIITDRHNEVVETNNGNNLGSANTELQLPPPTELNITGVTPPSSIVLGEAATFEWTVQNSSSNAASGIWQDTLYLSTDTTWDSGDIVIGSKQRSGTLTGFASYTETLETVVPPVDPGSYYVIVRTDSRNSIRESNESNNVAASVGQSQISVQNLTLGVPVNTTLVTGQERFFSVLNTPTDEVMLINLDGETGSSNELYTRFGSMVSRANYELQGFRPGEPDQENVVSNTQAGSYFTMIRGDVVPGSFAEQLREGNKSAAEKKEQGTELAPQNVTLRAELLPFTIRRVSPESAGNAGIASLQVDGAKFDANASLKLVGSGGLEITPAQMAAGPTRIAAIFDLTGKPAGSYDVVVTNPNSQSTTLEDGFEIVEGGGYQLRASIPPGPTVGRGGLTQRFTFTAHNDGTNDAFNVPIFIQIPAGYAYQIDRSNFLDYPAEDLPPEAIPNNIPLHFDVAGIRVIMLYAPLLRSGASINIRVDVTLPVNFGEFPVAIQLLPSLGDAAAFLGPSAPGLPSGLSAVSVSNAMNQPVDSNCWKELFRQAFFAAISEILPSDCLQAGWTILAGSADFVSGLVLKGAANVGTWDAVSSLASKFVSTAGKLAECAGKSIPWFRAVSIALTLVQLLSQLDDCLGGRFKQQVIFRQPLSIDPNEKLGPAGYGAEKFISVQQPIEYRINFENLATAEAPAQVVRIVDELPSTLDPRTFRLKEIGFKQYRVAVPENRAFFQTRMQLGEDLGNIQAEISAGLNIQNGTVTWTLTAIDSRTNERPLSPLAGLLPPNNEDRDGEGFVTFTIQPKATQTTGTEIANFATIIFDENEPIVTNATSSTLDADIPTSSVAPLPATLETPEINLTWDGNDAIGGSGVKGVDIFFSENGGPYQPLLNAEGPGSALFLGNWGRTYRFISVATDNAGNIEAIPATPDAVVSILGGATESDLAPRPNGNNDGTVSIADLTQVRRFVSGLDVDFQYNEFQRADTAPLATSGDGVLSVGDIVQSRRYVAGLDEVKNAAGPNAAIGGATVKTVAGRESAMGSREIKPVRLTRSGDQVGVAIEMAAQGDEVAVGFTLNFDPQVISNPANISLGSGASGMSLTINSSQAAAGRLGIVLDKDPTQPLPAGTQQLVTMTFTVAQTNPASALIAFGNSPVRREAVNGLAESLSVTFTDAAISLLAPTSAPATLAGRVTDAAGSGIPLASITLTDGEGNAWQTITSSFGNYRIEGLGSGRLYFITVERRQYQFAVPARSVQLNEDLFDVDFRAVN